MLACDHDMDGTASAAVLWTAMVDCFGVASDRICVITSHRLTEGYGIGDGVVTRIEAFGAQLVISADKGSSDEPRIATLAAQRNRCRGDRPPRDPARRTAAVRVCRGESVATGCGLRQTCVRRWSCISGNGESAKRIAGKWRLLRNCLRSPACWIMLPLPPSQTACRCHPERA